MSVAGESSRNPRACSGAMYSGVPTAVPVWVNTESPSARFAIPKSRILTAAISPCGRKRLVGLRSVNRNQLLPSVGWKLQGMESYTFVHLIATETTVRHCSACGLGSLMLYLSFAQNLPDC